MPRETFVKTESYHVEWEIESGLFHLHCTVDKWAPSVLKELYYVFVNIREFAKNLGYKEMVTCSPNPKFCRLFGGEPIGVEHNGEEVMVWEVMQAKRQALL